MQKLFQVTSHGQQGGITVGEINEQSQHKKQTFWDKPGIKILLAPLILLIVAGLINYVLKYKGMADDIFNVTSNNQQGGLTVGQLNVGVPPRHLTDEIKGQLVGVLQKKKIKFLVINGNAEANQYAIEISTFLKSKGWEVDPSFGFLMTPASGIDIRENNDFYTIIIGSAS